MLSRHRVSRQAIELIKRFEGYRQKAAQLPDGRWTIGYGHTLTAREGAEVSETDAEALLVYDLIAVQHAVNEGLLAPIGQNEFDALCSFAFNIGLDNFRRSQVLKRLNAGASVQAACAMELWRKADFEGERIVVDALVRRRAAEKALFLSPDDGVTVAAPSPLLRPAIDLDALDLVPLRRPVEVQTSMEGARVTARRDDLADVEANLPPEPAPEPAPAVTAAAAAVAGRLSALLAEPGEEPEPQEIDLFEPAGAEPLAVDAELRPQADFAEPITVEAEPAVEAEPKAETETQAPPLHAEPEPEADGGLDIPQAPATSRDEHEAPIAEISLDAAPSDFIPARNRPPPAQQELSVIWVLLLMLFGLAFIGFGIFWGLYAHSPVGGADLSRLVAWSAGVSGILFVAVAVYYLLQRLGREAEQD